MDGEKEEKVPVDNFIGREKRVMEKHVREEWTG